MPLMKIWGVTMHLKSEMHSLYLIVMKHLQYSEKNLGLKKSQVGQNQVFTMAFQANRSRFLINFINDSGAAPHFWEGLHQFFALLTLTLITSSIYACLFFRFPVAGLSSRLPSLANRDP